MTEDDKEEEQKQLQLAIKKGAWSIAGLSDAEIAETKKPYLALARDDARAKLAKMGIEPTERAQRT